MLALFVGQFLQAALLVVAEALFKLLGVSLQVLVFALGVDQISSIGLHCTGYVV